MILLFCESFCERNYHIIILIVVALKFYQNRKGNFVHPLCIIVPFRQINSRGAQATTFLSYIYPLCFTQVAFAYSNTSRTCTSFDFGFTSAVKAFPYGPQNWNGHDLRLVA